MRVIAIGSRVFVTSFQLAGVEGIKISSSAQILSEINKLRSSEDVGLILLSDDMAKEIRFQLTDSKIKKTYTSNL